MSTPRPLVHCPACQGPMKPVGRWAVRRDAAQAGYLVAAQPGDGQPAIGLDTLRCHSCGRLDIYDFDFLLPSP